MVCDEFSDSDIVKATIWRQGHVGAEATASKHTARAEIKIRGTSDSRGACR